MTRLRSLVVGAGLWAAPLTAQDANRPPAGVGETGAPGSTVATARRAAAAPRIDGVLDDLVWQTAPRMTGFVQRDPDDGAPGTEPTEFQVIYTDDALFVGVRAHDSRADEIQALLTRRDEWSPSDWIAVMVDSYRDRRTAFQFLVNAAGVKRDVFLYNDSDEDERWDAVWHVATTVDAEGWTAEFMIPFSQLRFPRSATNTFGFNVGRVINRRNEEQYWQPLPKDARGQVSLYGDLVGLEQIRPPRRLEILPYTLARTTERTPEPGNPFLGQTASSATFGADIKYGLNSWLTLSATVNPDFGQVDADPAVVNLSAFETFFPERRPFFTEGLDIFRFGLGDGDGDGANEQLFYTRRVGRRPQGRADRRGGFAQSVQASTILGAAKLSGKAPGGWTVGMTGAVTGTEHAQVIDSLGAAFRDAIEPQTVYLVGRVAKDLREGQTQLGLFGTTVQRDVPERLSFLHTRAYTGGMNVTHRFANDNFQVSGRVAGSYVRGSESAIAETQRASARYFQRPDADYLDYDPTRRTLTGFAAAGSVGKYAGNWRGATGVDTRSPGFEVNDLGFMQSTDYTSQWLWLNRRWLEPGAVFRRFNVNLNQWSSWTYGGDRRNIGGNVNANYQLRNYWNGWFGVNRQFGGLGVGQLRGGPAINTPAAWNGWFGMATDFRKALRLDVTFWGRMEDENASRAGGIELSTTWRPTANTDITASPEIRWNRDEWQFLRTARVNDRDEYLFGDLRQTTVSMTLRGNVTLSPTFSFQAYVEPFISAGRYETLRRVATPRAAGFLNQFQDLTADQLSVDEEGQLQVDLDRDGTLDVNLKQPDFTVLSFRSNFVLRWEYNLGSTLFLVWQHGRSGDNDQGRFNLSDNVGDLFASDHENVLLLKINYWINP